MMAVVSGYRTSAVINELEPTLDYKFQVLATVTEDGRAVEGERSSVVTGRKTNTKLSPAAISILSVISIGGREECVSMTCECATCDDTLPIQWIVICVIVVVIGVISGPVIAIAIMKINR